MKSIQFKYLLLALMLGQCILFEAEDTYAQTYDFQTFTVENGLSQSQILCLHQSKTGELWMGTNQGGINKFNGTDFSYITKTEGLSDNVVYSIVQQSSGRVLVGTNNGLSIIEGNKVDTFKNNRHLPHPGVVSLLLDHTGIVWLGTGKGVAMLVKDSVQVFEADSLLSASTILNIREGEDGSVWFCTVQNGLFRMKDHSIEQYNTKDGLGHNYVFDVMPVTDEHAWVFGYRGLYHLKNGSISPIQLPASIPENSIFYGYEKDRAGNVWIGCSAGVLKYQDGEFITLTENNGLVNNNIWKILQDREGNLWFGSKSNGVSKLNSERFKIYKSKNMLPNPAVNTVFRDTNGSLWSGTKRGISVWRNDSVSVISQEDGLSSEIIRDIDQAENGTIYIATNYGLSVFTDGKVSAYLAEEKHLNSIHDVFADGTIIWLGTNIGPAVFENGEFIRPANANQFNKTVFDATRKGENIWFAYDDGVLKYDGTSFQQFTKKDGFFDGRTRSITVGPEGHLWFGTNDGIYRYNGDSCTNFNVENGLISDAVYSLGFHQDGSLWAGQSKGLSRLLFDENELEDVIRYGKEQGFLGLECSTNSIWMDDDAKIWVGATNGLVEYDPEKDKGVHYKPLTRLTDIRLFSQTTDWSPYADSISESGIPVSLTLPYDKNHLTFEFSGVSLTSPASINYSYILEGLEDDWQPITNENSAKYSNIPPGSYTFKVRAGFGDELWKNRPISFNFEVRPPFYQTNWFYLLCAVLALAAGYSYFTIRRANIQITEQKQEIEEQRDVIETKNQALVDSINYASTIQSATLPADEVWHSLLPNSFILYKPKDIVSGDFYWIAEKGDEVIFAAVDCTGHGVPGALMSMVGSNGLNKAVKEKGLTRPAEILRQLSSSVNDALHKTEKVNYLRDGMDLAICKLNRKTLKLEYAGSVNPLVLIRDGKLDFFKGDRTAIGSLEAVDHPFTNHEFELKKGDCIYIFSDGYADQFGGEHGKKMKAANMRKKLLEFSKLKMTEQKRELVAHLEKWQGPLTQVDDICVIGVRV